MASFIWFLSVVVYAKFMCAESADKLLSLDCQSENHGVYGKDTLLKCMVNSGGQSIKIVSASWRRLGEKVPLLSFMYDEYETPKDQRFSFAQPLSGRSTDVSFLMRDTKRTDEGKYECDIVADIGEDKATVSLIVTATYSKPEMSSIPEKDIQEETEITIFCNASGGYPVGMIHWYDEYDSNWTHSAEMTVVETPDKRVNLSSKFTLKASSMSTQYKCLVLNNKGIQEGEAIHKFEIQKGPEKVEGDRNSTSIAAIVVVAGSLLCGLLVLALLRRRHIRMARRLSTHPILDQMHAQGSDMMEEGSAGLRTEPASQSFHD